MVICTNVKVITDQLAIDNLARKYNIIFPEGFKSFFKENNGGIPKKTTITVSGTEYSIRCFLSFNEGEYNSIGKPLAWFQEKTNGKIIPIAKDDADNYYCLNVETGKIYFFDNDDDLYYYISETFPEFIGRLQ